MEQVTMRSILAFSLLMALCISATAAPVHRAKRLEGRLRPSQHGTVLKSYAVPGWTDEQTQHWLDNATASAGLG
jgi:hypothetical protein